VVAEAEGDVRVWVAPDVETRRALAEHVLVAVGRREEHEHGLTLGDGDTAQLRGTRGGAHEGDDR
jgi:hypothetical protein